VLWMRFDDVNGSGEPTDLSSYSNNGTLFGDALINSSGYFGSGAHFDGINDGNLDFINISSLVNEQAFRGSFSISVWAKPVGRCGSNFCYIIIDTRATSSTAGFVLEMSGAAGTESYRLNANNGTSGAVSATDPATITFGEWSHVVGVYNQSHITVYVNGINVADTVSPQGGLNSSRSVRIGGVATQNRIWNGSIDEVLIFNRTLTPIEISTLYNASATQYENNFTGLSVGTHKFTGHAVDLVGNRNSTAERSVTIEGNVSISISLSTNLSTSISWDIQALPAINQSAGGNNDDNTNITTYFINISAQETNVDLYIQANSDLLSSGGDIIGLGNETYSYNTTNSSVPSLSKFSITTNYADNKIGNNLPDGSSIYLKFFLSAPSGQAAASYNNSLSFKAVEFGQSP